MGASKRLIDLLASICLVTSTGYLAARFDRSIAFERPLPFAFLTLLATGAIFSLVGRCVSSCTLSTRPRPSRLQHARLECQSSSTYTKPPIPAAKLPIAHFGKRLVSALRLDRVLRSLARKLFMCIVGLILCRTALLWRTMRDFQCTRTWLATFLPFAAYIVDWALPPSRSWASSLPLTQPRPIGPNHLAKQSRVGAGPEKTPTRFMILRHAALALMWAIATSATTKTWESQTVTGAICPRGWWRSEGLVAAAQAAGLVVDAAVATLLARIRTGASAGSPDVAYGAGAGFVDVGGGRHDNDWNFLSSVCLSASVSLVAAASLALRYVDDIMWPSPVAWTEASDLVLDVVAASVLAVSFVHLLQTFHPATVMLAITGLGLHIHRLATMSDDGFLGRRGRGFLPSLLPLVALACAGLLLRHDKGLHSSSTMFLPCPSAGAGDGNRRSHSHKALTLCYFAPVAFLAVLDLSLPLDSTPRRSAGSAIGPGPLWEVPSLGSVISSSYAESERWQGRAAKSKTLEEAVQEYRRRHGIPPPPNFDRWYEFATSRNSCVIDDFSQITADLRPFWGLAPSVIRERTAHLLEHPWVSMGGLRVQNGSIRLSPHTPGTHMWMMEGMAEMIRPFARWLPDMDLAFNLDDECRAAVPHEQLAALQHEAKEAHGRLSHVKDGDLISFFDASQRSVLTTTSTTTAKDTMEMETPKAAGAGSTQSHPWSDQYLRLDGAHSRHVQSRFFTNYHNKPIFRDLVAPACTPDSPARKLGWWNKKESCFACAAPHTVMTLEGRAVSNWTGAGDVCLQPDLAHLSGFLLSPAAMLGTKMLFPIFSQAKVRGFSDVLIPSPWNFNGKSAYDSSKDMTWARKRNAVFWRGSSSDGFAVGGSWETFLRARFVDEADAAASRMMEGSSRNTGKAAGYGGSETGLDRLEKLKLTVNVSFVSEFHKCERTDCEAETDTFYRHRRSKSNPQPSGNQHGSGGDGAAVPFEEHWRYRHLVDLDGAGFSGRFLPFLQSQSLVYRAALFRTWFDERVHPWRHFVPLDIRLGNGLWSVLAYFSGGRGSHLGEQIAVEGSEWANKALRREDMEIYMFRLLIEWGRIVDDRREEIGLA